MKPIFRAITLTALIVATSEPVLAGRLLNQVSGISSQHNGIHANLQAMTPTGIKKFQEFRDVVSFQPKGKGTAWGESHLAFVKPYADGRGNTVHLFETKPDGTVIQSAFETPQIMTTPQLTRVTLQSRSEGGVGVYNEFNTISGVSNFTQTFEVRLIDGRAVRVQKIEMRETGQVDTAITHNGETGNLVVQVANFTLKTEHPNAFLAVHIPTREDVFGPTIGFNLSANGSLLRVYTLKNGEVTERTIVLVPNAANKETQNMDPRMDYETRSVSKLDKKEVARLGFFKAEIKTFPGRKEASSNPEVRGLKTSATGQQ